MARKLALPKIEMPPRGFHMAALILLIAALVPFALVARYRGVMHSLPRIHVVPNMDNQPRFKYQQANPLFADGREMRPPVRGTVAREELREDDHFYRGIVNGHWATTFPIAIDEKVIQRGQQRFNIYCAPCHGYSGQGDGMVERRARFRQQATFISPANLTQEPYTSRPLGHLFNTISNGIRTMPPYRYQIPEADRWAIVAYVKTLQFSQNAKLEDVPPEARKQLR